MTVAYKAKPLSRRDIRELTKMLRMKLGLERELYFPIVEFLEIILPNIIPEFSLEVVPVGEMLNKEGETFPAEARIRLREDIYERACAGDGRARFTVAHEIGHLILHRDYVVSLCRTSKGEYIRPFEDPEWQANTFAGELLASSYLIKNMTAADVRDKCCVTITAARVQLDKSAC